MSAQVSALCCTGYYQLRQLRPLVRCLSDDVAKILIQAFINTRLDYCNSLYIGIADGLMSRLQSVQNAATRLITGVRRCEHITPAALAASPPTSGFQDYPPLSIVRWLVVVVVYYRFCVPADECTLVTAAGRRPLRSADNRTCLVKRSRNQVGDRCFATAEPTLWSA